MFYREKEIKLQSTNIRMCIRILEDVTVTSASVSVSALRECQPFLETGILHQHTLLYYFSSTKTPAALVATHSGGEIPTWG